MSVGLPTVVATSVIRSACQGESHGGAFLVDLATEENVQVLDWNDGSIDWTGRGGDRGLRGMAFYQDRIFLAASDEVFVFDSAFNRLGSIACPYLKHCHEIAVHRDRLYLTSTGYDSILVFDLVQWRFVEGICLRPLALKHPRFNQCRIRRGLGRRLRPLNARFYRLFTSLLQTRRFDPTATGGPEPLDILHINNVYADDTGLFVCGTELDALFQVCDGYLRRIAAVPLGTHNTHLAEGALVFHDTAAEYVTVAPNGPVERFRLPRYGNHELQHADVDSDHARQSFGRGLCLAGDLIIAGSSPATVSVYRCGRAEPIKMVNLTLDVRNAIHGLEVWPFDLRLSDWRARVASVAQEAENAGVQRNAFAAFSR